MKKMKDSSDTCALRSRSRHPSAGPASALLLCSVHLLRDPGEMPESFFLFFCLSCFRPRFASREPNTPISPPYFYQKTLEGSPSAVPSVPAKEKHSEL